MGMDKIILILACVSGAFTFTCPDNSNSFYHAVVSTGCTVYHVCENSQLSTMTCPAGKAFNYVTSQCEDASTVSCIETMENHHMHHHHKRAIDEYHTIPIQKLQTAIVDLYYSIKPLIITAIQDVAPSAYAKFEAEYLPSIQTTQKEFMPFFYEKVWPKVKKSATYARNMTARILKKVYESYELSNSTHITLVSVSDLANDISNDLKPVLNLGRYMTSRLVQNTRPKRSADNYDVPHFITGVIEPFIKSIFSSIGATFVGQENTVTSKLILPILFKMLEDPETRFDLKKVFFSTKAIFSPVIWEMLSRQTFDTPEGTIIRIPRATVDIAMDKFFTETKPIIHKILNKHLSMILTMSSHHVPVIMKTVEMLHDAKYPHSGILKDAILNFITKHGSVLQTSDSRYINTYTLTEIKQDLKPIFITFLQVGVDYFSMNKNSWVNMFFNRDSHIYKSLVGKPVYAKPSYGVVNKGKIFTRSGVYRG